MFLPGESQGQGSLVGYRLWGHIESDTTEVKQQQQQQQQWQQRRRRQRQQLNIVREREEASPTITTIIPW